MYCINEQYMWVLFTSIGIVQVYKDRNYHLQKLKQNVTVHSVHKYITRNKHTVNLVKEVA